MRKKRLFFLSVLFKIFIKTLLVIVIILILFLGFLTIIEYRPDDIESLTVDTTVNKQASLDQSLSFMTFNIGYGGLGKHEDFVLDGGVNGRPSSEENVLAYLDGIMEIMADNHADFYLLQEVDLDSTRSFNLNQMTMIHESLGSQYDALFAYNYKAFFVPFPFSLTDHLGKVESGLLTLSNHTMKEGTRYQFPGAFDWPLRIVNLKRSMMAVEIEIEDSESSLIVVNLHLSAYDGDGSLREEEMTFLKAYMESEYEKGNYVVVGGDFNQTFPSVVDVYPVIQDYYVAFPIEEEWLLSSFSFVIDETLPTCRLLNQPYNPLDIEKTQYYIIDGFIVSDNIFVEHIATIDHDFEYSDHNPVMMTIRLKP
ncbi:MAG: endonuclease/exonuclease/phosphatase family protein [Candidatus Izemoplasmataceae bacterium]